DGTSNTIVFTEKYGLCGQLAWNKFNSDDYAVGCTMANPLKPCWYDDFDPGTGAVDGLPAGQAWGSWGPYTMLATIACSMGRAESFDSGKLFEPVGPASMFQVQPVYNLTYGPVAMPARSSVPPNGAPWPALDPRGCDILRASTPHSVMNVTM